MTDKLFHLKEIMEIYGLSEYEARTLMSRVQKINVGRGEHRPRWVVKQSVIEAYLQKKAQRNETSGLDYLGRIIRRR